MDSSMMSTSDFMNTFLDNNRPPPESVEYFKSIPWLESHISDPHYQLIPMFSRHLKSSGEDYFFSRTINTETTIPHFIALRLRDLVTPDATTTNSTKQENNVERHKQITIVPEKPDAVMLLSIGDQGLNGHPSTIHGGVTCALMDETLGLLTMLHANNNPGTGSRDSLYTANLNVSYRAPVPTPGDYLVKTWLASRQGRKWVAKGQLVDKDGKVLAEADGLWVAVKRDKL